MIKPILLLLGFALLGLLIAYYAIRLADATCIPQNGEPKWASKHLIEANQPNTGPKKQNDASRNIPAAFNGPQPNANEQEAGQSANGIEPLINGWAHEFWCRATATDYAIAYFTYCLVIVGAFSLWRTEHILRETGRAHIFPNFTRGPGEALSVIIQAQNAANAPGSLRKIYGEYSQTKPPIWTLYRRGKLLTYDEMVSPNSICHIKATFPSTTNGEQFMFGYVEYLDMFHSRHRSYYCVHFMPGQGIEYSGTYLNRFW